MKTAPVTKVEQLIPANDAGKIYEVMQRRYSADITMMHQSEVDILLEAIKRDLAMAKGIPTKLLGLVYEKVESVLRNFGNLTNRAHEREPQTLRICYRGVYHIICLTPIACDFLLLYSRVEQL
jgi:hypothetical protein